MKRCERFKYLSGIKDEFILESMPDTASLRRRKRDSESPVIRFLNSGWGVACICTVVALSIMTVILRLRPNFWNPPGGISTETDTLVTETVTPTLPPETEALTEADTTPYFDPATLDIQTYRGMTPDIPYKLSYYSYGDGTCMVDDIVVNILYQGDITVEIPEISPHGDKVIRVSFRSVHNLPLYIPAEDFDKIQQAALDYWGNEDNIYYRIFMSYFTLRSAALASTPALREDLIDAYPLCEFVPVVVFDPTTTGVERALRSEDLTEMAPWYTAEWCYSDLLKAKTLADTLGVTDPLLEQAMEQHSGDLSTVLDIKLPKTLIRQEEDMMIEYALYPHMFAAMGVKQMSFDGTMADMTAILGSSDITVERPLSIRCSDGDIVFITGENRSD